MLWVFWNVLVTRMSINCGLGTVLIDACQSASGVKALATRHHDCQQAL